MNEKNAVQSSNELNFLQDMILNEVCPKFWDALTDAENNSKEKYATKQRLIESANDMTTQERSDAIDKNYGCRNHERWQIALSFAMIYFIVVGIAYRDPSALKNICNLFTLTHVS